LEHGLLPHFNSQGAPEDVEEERRLLYVGMTRARERLLLTCCRRRRIAGRYQDQLESPFLAELPGELLDVSQSPALFEAPRRDAPRQGTSSFCGGGDGGNGRGEDEGEPEPSPGAAWAGRGRAAGAWPGGRRHAGAGGNRYAGTGARHPGAGPGS